MYKTFSKAVILVLSFTLFSILFNSDYALAQFSVSYEAFPSSLLANPNTTPVNGQRNFEQDMEIQVSALQVSAGFPMAFSEGKTVLMNQFTYGHMKLEYDNWDLSQGGTNQINDAYTIEYNATLIHQKSERWTIMTILTPGFSSDFIDELSKDDFSIQAVAVFIRKHSETLSIGYGAAYSNKFGQPFPVPILAINWNNGANLSVESILPVDTKMTYKLNERTNTGLHMVLNGNQYHGATSKFDVDNPTLRYSVATLGTFLNRDLGYGMKINLSGGFTFMRRFEFYDGDTEERSLDLKNKGYIRVGFTFGG